MQLSAWLLCLAFLCTCLVQASGHCKCHCTCLPEDQQLQVAKRSERAEGKGNYRHRLAHAHPSRRDRGHRRKGKIWTTICYLSASNQGSGSSVLWFCPLCDKVRWRMFYAIMKLCALDSIPLLLIIIRRLKRWSVMHGLRSAWLFLLRINSIFQSLSRMSRLCSYNSFEGNTCCVSAWG